MIRHLLIFLFTLYTSVAVSGQIKKDNTVLSGSGSLNLGINSSTEDFGIRINPFFGKFFTDKLLVGANTGINYSTSPAGSSWAFSLGPAMRYYLSVNEKFSPFITAGANYINSKIFITSSGYGFNLGLGGSVHINDHITLDITSQYLRTKYGSGFSSIATNDLFFQAGFSVYFDRSSE